MDALVAAIAASPDDDTPRMVYADWLMQRGDARGELIALQCRIAAGTATPEILASERELRVALEPELLAPLQAMAPGGYEVRRGFVEHAEPLVPPEQLRDRLGALFAHAPLLRSLGLVGATAAELPAAMVRVEALTLHELGVGANTEAIEQLLASPELARLRRLEVTNGRLFDRAVTAVCAMPAPLEHLRLDGSFPYPTPERANDGDRALAAIAASPARAHLRSLVLVGFTVRSLEALQALPRLTQVVLHECETPNQLAPPGRVRVAFERPALTARPTFPARLAEQLRAGKIPAIIEYRELTGVGLAEGKVAVERLLGERA